METTLQGHGMDESAGDPWIGRLAALFAEHQAWQSAAALLAGQACSTVYFSHKPSERWQLHFENGAARLAPGAAADPDLIFRFSPESIAALEAVDGGIGDFAVALFEQITSDRAQLRIAVPFARLAGRGYVKLLFAAGPRVLAFGARHGIRTVIGLRRFVADQMGAEPAEWELGAKDDASEAPP